MTMQTFTGFQYLLIDAANHMGLDKLNFEHRLEWAYDNFNDLEAQAPDADKPPLFTKAVMAIRDAQAGKPSGHLVGFDAVCSGMQIMSALTGCMNGAMATGLVDPANRADAYSKVTDVINRILGQGSVTVSRKAAKQAVMTTLYGSKKEPKAIFGEDTPELVAFYEAMNEVAPGAMELLMELLGSWQPFALSHDWVLPDNYHAHVPVMEKVEKRIEVDELDHATFTYEYYENIGQDSGLSNVANVVHSIDAYVLRSLIRRCNYDRPLIQWAVQAIERVLVEREMDGLFVHAEQHQVEGMALTLQERYEATRMADTRILDYVQDNELYALSSEHLRALSRVCESMLTHEPFPIVSVHDEFKCHANNMNHLRQHYIDIFAEMAESTILADVLGQIHGVDGSYDKLSSNLSDAIRMSNYSLS